MMDGKTFIVVSKVVVGTMSTHLSLRFPKNRAKDALRACGIAA